MGLKQLLEEFSRKRVLAYARARIPRNYLGPTLFPVQTGNELTFEYWKDQNLLPVMANIQAFGAEAQVASRDGATKVSGEIPPIKRKIHLDERFLLALKREGAGDNDAVIAKLYNDLDNMIDSCFARIEKMRMDAISTGQIVLAENGVVMTVDYGVPAGLKETLLGNDLWSASTTCAPIDDIIGWSDLVVDSCGIKPERALTSNTVVANLLKSTQVRQMLYGDNGTTRAVTLEDVNGLMAQMKLPQIATYDLKVRVQAEDGTYTTMRFFPSNKFVLLPDGVTGQTLMGPTAEALLDGQVEAKEVGGIYARVDALDEPPAVWTKASCTSIPTFPLADGVFQAQVI